MKLSVPRNELWRGIDLVLDAVPSKPALPVLANILLTADKESLSLSATNMDLSIRTQVTAVVEEAGSITVPARTLAEIVREWPDAELSLEACGDRLELSGILGEKDDSGEGSFSLSGMSADDFPNMPSQLRGLSVELDKVDEFKAQTLVGMINRTAFAVMKDDTRPILNGVLWRIDPTGMKLVATDGHRFASYHCTLNLSAQVEATSEAIVPPQALGQVVKLLGAGQPLIKIIIGESQVLFDLGNTQLLSRLIEGPYVDYDQVIPKDNDRELLLTSQRFLSAVRRVSILSSSYTHQIRLQINRNVVELSAANPEIGGEARERVPAVYDEEEMEVGYNAQYLMEILRKIDAEQVLFQLKNPTTAAVLRPVQQVEGEEYFCLLMPLRPSG